MWTYTYCITITDFYSPKEWLNEIFKNSEKHICYTTFSFSLYYYLKGSSGYSTSKNLYKG